MYFLGLGLILLAMKYLEIGPVANWDWWFVLSPFALAVVWWAWADSTGWTKRKVIQKQEQRKQKRIDKNKEAIGTKRRNPR